MLLFNDNILFIEIPRTGTTTVRHYFERKNKCHEKRHITLSEYLQKEPSKRDFIKTTFVRNPFERIVSLYEHTKHFHGELPELSSFDSFVHWFIDNGRPQLTFDKIRMSQCDMIRFDGSTNLHFTGRFETYEKDLIEMGKTFNIKVIGEISKRNTFTTTPYQQYYSSETKALIEKFSQEDIETFHYKF